MVGVPFIFVHILWKICLKKMRRYLLGLRLESRATQTAFHFLQTIGVYRKGIAQYSIDSQAGQFDTNDDHPVVGPLMSPDRNGAPVWGNPSFHSSEDDTAGALNDPFHSGPEVSDATMQLPWQTSRRSIILDGNALG